MMSSTPEPVLKHKHIETIRIEGVVERCKHLMVGNEYLTQALVQYGHSQMLCLWRNSEHFTPIERNVSYTFIGKLRHDNGREMLVQPGFYETSTQIVKNRRGWRR
jgi:hypothetical protein